MNKYLTGQLINDPKCSQSLEIRSFEELERRQTSSQFPLVCKPGEGSQSEGVFRVDRMDQLRSAVARGLSLRGNQKVLIEPYVEGPEVDVNLFLRDGQLLHGESVDDFPSPAD